jgi:hypothetical protein
MWPATTTGLAIATYLILYFQIIGLKYLKMPSYAFKSDLLIFVWLYSDREDYSTTN